MIKTNWFDPETADRADDMVDHVNSAHSDTLMLVARHLARATGAPDPADAEMLHIDPFGADIAMRHGGKAVLLRLDFGQPVPSIKGIQHAFISHLTQARNAAASNEPLTSLERELADTPKIALRSGRLSRRRHITANVFEVTVSGLPDITEPDGDEFSYLLLTRDGSAFPQGWSMDDYRARSEDRPIIGAYYTIRRARPGAGELDLWVAMHDHPNGVATALLNKAKLGSEIVLWGARKGYTIPNDAESVLLVADETGTPAVAALIESAPASLRLTAVLETVDTHHQLPLPDHPLLTVHWVHRGRDPAGSENNRLLDTVRDVVTTAAPDAAFGAAESRHMSVVRRLIRKDLALPASRVLMSGYWRRKFT